MNRVWQIICCALVLTVVSSGLTGAAAQPAACSEIALKSSAFLDEHWLPGRFAKLNENFSPPLQWTHAPNGAKSFALTCTDLTRRNWAHWVIFNIPATANQVGENISKAEILADGSRQGLNDFGSPGYDGPNPPGNGIHLYCFHIYALDTVLKLPEETTLPQLLAAMSGHVLGQGKLFGIYI